MKHLYSCTLWFTVLQVQSKKPVRNQRDNIDLLHSFVLSRNHVINRLPRELVDTPSLETLKFRLEGL